MVPVIPASLRVQVPGPRWRYLGGGAADGPDHPGLALRTGSRAALALPGRWGGRRSRPSRPRLAYRLQGRAGVTWAVGRPTGPVIPASLCVQAPGPRRRYLGEGAADGPDHPGLALRTGSRAALALPGRWGGRWSRPSRPRLAYRLQGRAGVTWARGRPTVPTIPASPCVQAPGPRWRYLGDGAADGPDHPGLALRTGSRAALALPGRWGGRWSRPSRPRLAYRLQGRAGVTWAMGRPMVPTIPASLCVQAPGPRWRYLGEGAADGPDHPGLALRTGSRAALALPGRGGGRWSRSSRPRLAYRLQGRAGVTWAMGRPTVPTIPASPCVQAPGPRWRYLGGGAADGPGYPGLALRTGSRAALALPGRWGGRRARLSRPRFAYRLQGRAGVTWARGRPMVPTIPAAFTAETSRALSRCPAQFQERRAMFAFASNRRRGKLALKGSAMAAKLLGRTFQFTLKTP